MTTSLPRSFRASRIFSLGLFAAAAAAGAACGSTADTATPKGPSEWPQYGHDRANSRYNADESTLSTANVGSLVKKWTTRDNGDLPQVAVTSTPAVVGGVVYFGDWAGNLNALNVGDGTTAWQTHLPQDYVKSGVGAQINDSPLVTADRVYAAGYNSVAYAVDRASGAKLWDPNAPLGNQTNTVMWSSPNIIDDTMVIGVGSFQVFSSGPYNFKGNIVGVNATDGSMKWTTYMTDGNTTSGNGVSVWGSAAIDAKRGLMYSGTGQAYNEPTSPYSDAMVALNYATGEIKWAHQFTPDDVFTSSSPGRDWDMGASVHLFEAGGKELVGGGDKGGNYYALDRDTGDVVWSQTLTQGGRTGGVMASPAVANGVIYVYSNDGIAANFGSSGPGSGSAFALDAATGNILWQQPMTPGSFGGIAIANGLMFFTTLDGKIHALDITNGQELWSSQIIDGVNKAGGGVSVAGGMVFAGAGWDWQTAVVPGGMAAFGLP